MGDFTMFLLAAIIVCVIIGATKEALKDIVKQAIRELENEDN